MPSDQKQQAIWIHLIKSWITKCRGWPQLPRNVTWTIPAWFSWFVNDGRWPSRWACSPTTCALSNAIHGCTKKNWVVWLAGHENTSATLSCPRSSRLKEKNRSPSRSLQRFKKKYYHYTHPTILQPPDFTPYGHCSSSPNVKEMAGSGATTPRILSPSGCGRSVSSRTPSVHAWAFARSSGCWVASTPGKNPRMLEGHIGCSLLVDAAWKKPLVMRCRDQQGWWTSTFIPWILMKNFRGKPAKKVQEKNDPICGSKFCAFRIQSLLAWNCAHKNQQKSPVQVSHCMGVARTTPPHVMSQIPSCTSLRGSNWT